LIINPLRSLRENYYCANCYTHGAIAGYLLSLI